MAFSFRRDSEISPSENSSQMAPCFFRSMRTPTLRPLSSVTNWIPLMVKIPPSLGYLKSTRPDDQAQQHIAIVQTQCCLFCLLPTERKPHGLNPEDLTKV